MPWRGNFRFRVEFRSLLWIQSHKSKPVEICAFGNNKDCCSQRKLIVQGISHSNLLRRTSIFFVESALVWQSAFGLPLNRSNYTPISATGLVLNVSLWDSFLLETRSAKSADDYISSFSDMVSIFRRKSSNYLSWSSELYCKSTEIKV